MIGEVRDADGPDAGGPSADGPAGPRHRGDLGVIVEALVYAPLGLALEGRSLLPRLVERGRNHVTMARLVGEFAVRKGSEDLAAGVAGAQDRLLGLVARQRGGGGEAAERPMGTDAPAGDRSGTGLPRAVQVAPDDVAAAASIDPEELPIADYDLLSASQVVPRLESLDERELELVGRYEAGTRGRRTILAKIAQLRGGTPG